MPITGISRNRRAVWQVSTTLPPGKIGVYQLGLPFQVSPTEVGVNLNIRHSGVKTIDMELGNDLMIMNHLGGIDPKRIQVLNRSDIGPHPGSGNSTLFVRYPLLCGFVPLGALRSDGTSHPHAGTGFGIGQNVGFPGDRVVANEMEYEDAALYQYHGLEIQQYRYDGEVFRVMKSTSTDGRCLVPEYHLYHPGMTSPIPDGEDLLQPFCAKQDGMTGCGVLRWRSDGDEWRPVEFSPVIFNAGRPATTDEYLPAELFSAYTEPSLVRDSDGSLLFTARAQGTQPYAPGPLDAEHVRIWRSEDGGCSWSEILAAPHVRALTPMSLNRAVDGTIYLVANPARTTNSLGQKLGSIVMRESLMIWPLANDRESLLTPVAVRDCPKEFGAPPHKSFWRIDHPVGLTVRLADRQWHHILVFRGLEHDEGDGDAPITPFTGTYIEEIYCDGEPLPVWNFQVDI